ncbi:MAG: cysteine rich repeat-containing protein [Deltaproteobacteria bacterium]|nr:cysteine rich repeat-containing protein [Deltaproteobacteria bacterium]
MKKIDRFYFVTMVVGLLCLGLMLYTNASAAVKNPCSEDIEKFCKNVKPGPRAIMNCLEEHESELSNACKEYEAKLEGPRVERKEEIREKIKFRQACKADVIKFCKDIDPVPGGIEKCLNEHKNELSTSCSESIKALKEEKKKKE